MVNKLWEVSRATRVEPGWHYLLDLTWIVENLGPVNGKQILDAGAGMGLMQWYLIESGAAEVISADRGSRYDLPSGHALTLPRCRFSPRTTSVHPGMCSRAT